MTHRVPRLHNLTSLDIVCATYAQCYYLSAPRDTPSLEVLLCGQMLRPVPLLLSAMFYAVLTDAVAAASAVLVMLCVCGTSSRTAVRLAMPSHGRVRSVTTAPVRHCDCAVVTLAACLVACCAANVRGICTQHPTQRACLCRSDCSLYTANSRNPTSAVCQRACRSWHSNESVCMRCTHTHSLVCCAAVAAAE